MRKIVTKIVAVVLVLFGCCLFSSCEKVKHRFFCDIRLEENPTWSILEEEDGEYTVIIEGYAKNYSNKAASRSEAVAYLYNEKGKRLESNWRLVSDTNRIGEGEVWHFYIVKENLPVKPATFKVKVFEDV